MSAETTSVTPGDPSCGSGAPITIENLRLSPKVLLHDHLDGGLRPATIIDLARESAYRELPTEDPAELGRWFVDNANAGSHSSAWRTLPPTAWSTPKSGLRPSYTLSGA
jgi:adenosine deaminase